MLSSENRPNVPNIIIRKFYHIITLFMFIPVIYINVSLIFFSSRIHELFTFNVKNCVVHFNSTKNVSSLTFVFVD